MTQTNSQTRWVNLFVVAGLVIFGASGWAWWHYIRSNPERTFYAAVENSLSTYGVSKTITQESGSQNLRQNVTFSIGGSNGAQSLTDVSQSGETSAAIQTETLSTDKEEYVRYTKIQTDQKKQNGEAMDFSKLVGVWGKSDAPRGGDLFTETILGVVPVGNLPAKERQSLMNLIRDNDVYSWKDAKRGIENGRPVYTYDVTVAPEAYVGMLKEFAHGIGMKQLESVDPSNYKDAEPLTFTLKIDVWGQYISEITYQGGQRTEALKNYGAPRQFDLPKDAISIEDLQGKLQEAQQ